MDFGSIMGGLGGGGGGSKEFGSSTANTTFGNNVTSTDAGPAGAGWLPIAGLVALVLVALVIIARRN